MTYKYTSEELLSQPETFKILSELSDDMSVNGIDKPVNYIRENYCKEAVETVTQEMFVNIYLKYIKSLSR